MTPFDKAMIAYHEDMRVCLADDQAVERAISVYLTALSEDEVTVAAMCKAFAPEVPETVAGIHYETEWSRLTRKMRRALKVLATKEPT